MIQMKIEYNCTQKMTIEEFADAHQLIMEVGTNECRPPLYKLRFHARLKGVDIADGGILIGAYGRGDTGEEAIDDYTRQISGKDVVMYPFDPDRRCVIKVPTLSKATEPMSAIISRLEHTNAKLVDENDHLRDALHTEGSFTDGVVDDNEALNAEIVELDCALECTKELLRTVNKRVGKRNELVDKLKTEITALKNQRRDLTAVVAESELVTESKSRQERIVKNWQAHEHNLLNVIEYHANRCNRYVQTNQSLREENDTLKAEIVNLRAQLDAHKRFVSVCKTTSENRKYVVESLRRAICEFETMENY